MARIGLRMMPPFPWSPLKFRKAGFPLFAGSGSGKKKIGYVSTTDEQEQTNCRKHDVNSGAEATDDHIGERWEFAIRSALGASRFRLILQLLVESLILAVGGAILETLLAWGGLKFLVALAPQDFIPAETVIRFNSAVLLFTLGVTFLTALTFGLVPALTAARKDLHEPLRDAGKGLSGSFRHGELRKAVVVVEVALSLTLMVSAVLLMRSFVALREVISVAHYSEVIPDGLAGTSLRRPTVSVPPDGVGFTELLAGFTAIGKHLPQALPNFRPVVHARLGGSDHFRLATTWKCCLL